MEASNPVIALPDGASLLHIGMPKTGTTSLQAALDESRAALEELGVHNVTRNRHEMKVALTAAGTLPGYWGDDWQERWRELAEDFRTSSERCTLWSSETLTQAKPDRIRHIAEQLGRDDIHVVLTLRPLAAQLASQWQQHLRRRGRVGLDTWMRSQFDAVSIDGTVAARWDTHMPTLHRFSLRRVVEQWGAVFGEERLIFVIPPPMDFSFNLCAFESLMGVPEGTLVVPDLDNASLPYPEAEMLRHFNITYTERGGSHPTWKFTVGGPGKVAMNKLTGLPRHPIRTPRWAAELANEYTEDWIRAVGESGARVIGEFDDLLVDPETFPETVDEPQMVSVESAGRLAELLYQSALEYDGKPKGLARTTRTRDSARPATETPEPTSPALDEAPASELVTELGRRVRRRLGRRVRGK